MDESISKLTIAIGIIVGIITIFVIYLMPFNDNFTLSGSKNLCDSSLGDLAKQIDKNSQIVCHNVNVFYYIGNFIAFVSLMMVIYGILDLYEKNKTSTLLIANNDKSETSKKIIDDDIQKNLNENKDNPEVKKNEYSFIEDDLSHTIKLRYAKGEITKKEMDEMIKNLSK